MRAPAVSSASGTPPLNGVQAHAPARGVREGMLARALLREQPSAERLTSTRPRASASASAPIDKVVTQVARFVSIGQLPSGRFESIRNPTPCSRTGLSIRPMPARLMTTKLVSGVASR